MNINATIIEHAQGSDGWLQHRARSLNASELAAVMGLSSYATRADILKQKTTGLAPEVNEATQRRFDAGHRFEAIARPWAEEILGEDLFPVVLAAEVEGLSVSASLDGQTMPGETTFEHKSGRADLLASLAAGVIPEEYHPQMEQGLLLSGASRCLFMASSGDRESMRFAWYESNPALRAKIIPTWKQFAADLSTFTPPIAAAVVVAEPVQALPAVTVLVEGSIAIKDNFPAFEKALRDFLEHRLIREPKTDQDFADLDVQIKAMKGAEAALASAEVQMLAQIQTVDQAKRTKDMLAKLVRDNRLMAEKLLTTEKERRRGEIVAAGVTGLREHIAALNKRLGQNFMPAVPADFGGAVSGKKNLSSMENAVATELARTKIAANEVADRIQINMQALVAAGDSAGAFHDSATLVLKAPDDLRAIIAQRVAETERKQAETRERIRAEEQAKAEKAARDTLATERDLQARRDAAAATPALTPTPSAIEAPAAPQAAPNVVPMGTRAPAPAGATLSISRINELLSPIALTGDGLERLGFLPVAILKTSKLYRESDLGRICEALTAHLHNVQQRQRAA
jgi:putative phage-type endonuclease